MNPQPAARTFGVLKLFGVALAVMLVVSALLLVVLFKFLKVVLRKLRGFLGGATPAPELS